MSGRHVALGSSFASGPGLPRGTAYPHLVARRLGLDLTDVSRSGATTAHVLREPQGRRAPQVTALDGTERLVTVTIGGNDLLMSAATMTAASPRWLRTLPGVHRRAAATLHAPTRLAGLEHVGAALRDVARTVRRRSPDARVVLVDYLRVLPPDGVPAPPIDDAAADLVRRLAQRLAEETARAARAEGCLVVRASAASLEHHAWSDDPWTTGTGLVLPGRPLALHPNAAGMSAVADLVVQAVAGDGWSPSG